ncbi:MAG: hypothetical protein FWE04_05905 [Oscillospiraceae bacterium]|nr:hypothetical protein [Oscillospiraceae bacterium]
MQKNKKKSNNSNIKWVIQAVLFTFVLSTIFNAGSSVMLEDVSIIIKVIVLIFIIFFGVLVGMIGMAAMAADEVPFHSMAARKVKGAKEALAILKNRDKVSNFCCDIIGGICGIVSGSSAAFLSVRLVAAYPALNAMAITLGLMGTVAALSVGSNAVATKYSVDYANEITYFTAKVISVFKRKKKR